MKIASWHHMGTNEESKRKPMEHHPIQANTAQGNCKVERWKGVLSFTQGTGKDTRCYQKTG